MTAMDVDFEKERLGKLLVALGDTPDEVANTLRAQQIDGYRGDAGTCPIANYLVGQTGLNACVQPGGITLYPDGDDYDESDTVGAKPTRAVLEFVTGFDNNRWPELVTEQPL